MLGFSTIEKLYQENLTDISKYGLWSVAVKVLNLSIQVHPDELNHIPSEGPTVIISNYPFGGADGIALSYLVEQRRQDFKVFVTNMLSEKMPEIKDNFLDVDLYAKDQKNKTSIKAASDFVKSGGALIIFPAGTPSQAKRLFGPAEDASWRLGVAKIIQDSQAKVTPVFIEGQNSFFFQFCGLIFPRIKILRTILLAHELLRKKDETIHLHIGSGINYQNLKDYEDSNLVKTLRSRVYALRKKKPRMKKNLVSLKYKFRGPKFRKSSTVHEIIDAVPRETLASFLDSYKIKFPESCLIESNRYNVMIIDGANVSEEFLLEIGRLREVTFRSVGEGTGKRCDLDEYDSTYHHLVVWNVSKQWISGSYRLGLSPVILKERGLEGFYTQPFFNIQKGFFTTLGDCVELGRSFVRREEQSRWVLFYLWKGLAQFLYRNKNYTYMFGSVSISQSYSDRSRQLISKYFLKNYGDIINLSQFIKAEIPYDYTSDLKNEEVDYILETLHSVDDLSKMVTDLENDLKPIPALVYRYAELGGRYITFTIDPDFGNTLDGFIVVSIKDIPREQLRKFLPESEVEGFLQRPHTPLKPSPHQAVSLTDKKIVLPLF